MAVRTTILLDEELYRKLIREALEKYGNARKLSLLINEKLKGLEKMRLPKKRMTFKIGKKLTIEQIERVIEEGLEEVG